MEGNRFENDQSNEKTAVSPDQSRHNLMDDGAIKKVGLLTSLSTECP
jgi:hypothetical protein